MHPRSTIHAHARTSSLILFFLVYFTSTSLGAPPLEPHAFAVALDEPHPPLSLQRPCSTTARTVLSPCHHRCRRPADAAAASCRRQRHQKRHHLPPSAVASALSSFSPRMAKHGQNRRPVSERGLSFSPRARECALRPRSPFFERPLVPGGGARTTTTRSVGVQQRGGRDEDVTPKRASVSLSFSPPHI